MDSDPSSFTCSRCNNLLELIKLDTLSKDDLFKQDGRISVWSFRKSLPFEEMKPVTLEEGGTSLLRSNHIANELGLDRVYIKNEGQNPTGSFKDRGMTVATTRAVQSGAKLLICASTGNTSASLAAYAARAGIGAAVLVPAGKVAASKLVQAIAYGAKMIRVEGGFDRVLSLTIEVISEFSGLYLMNSINPYRVEGQKTVAFEIYQQLGFVVPDYIVLPVGNAGNISAVWKGFKELKSWGIIDRLPILIGVQASGAAPIADMYAKGLDLVSPVSEPETIASAIRIGNPVSWKKALKAIKESKGMALSVTDEEIIQAKKELASKEGLFVESASATPIAALKLLKNGIKKDSLIVCIATGHGLKDQETIRWEGSEVIVSDKSSLMDVLSRH
jgi:threonine synthase